MKKYLYICISVIAVVSAAYSLHFCVFSGSSLLDENILALSYGGEGSQSSPHRLKKVGCSCLNGKNGFTLQCKVDGDLEKCTSTQQGSNACYDFTFKGVIVLCEGSGSFVEIN